MRPERIHIVKVKIEYSKYEPVEYFIDSRSYLSANPYNLFSDNDPIGIICTAVNIRLLTDEEWEDFLATGKVNNEQVIGYTPGKGDTKTNATNSTNNVEHSSTDTD